MFRLRQNRTAGQDRQKPLKDHTFGLAGLFTLLFITRSVLASATLLAVSANLEVEPDLDAVVEELTQVFVLAEADVLMLQEVVDEQYSESFVEGLANRLGFPFWYSPERFSEEEALSPRLATLSRFPIIEQRLIDLTRLDLVFKSRRRYALDTVLMTPSGELRVVNLHLDSRINFNDRLLQLETILEGASDEERPLLIGGDFNSNNYFWFLHMLPIPFVTNQAQRLVEELSRHGFTTPFDGLGPTHDMLRMKLDWVFGRKVSWQEGAIVPLRFSDHHLIWTRFELPATP